MQKVFVKNLGCKVNQYDSTALSTQFQSRGYESSSTAENADITILNTCSVTAQAEREARYLIRRYRRENPHSKIIVTGCYAQTDSAALVEMTEVDLVVPNDSKHELAASVDALVKSERDFGLQIAHKFLGKTSSPISENRQTHFKSSTTLFAEAETEQTRAFLKIQDGCNNFCSYCLIPYARGASRSVPKRDVLAEIQRLASQSYPEIVLTGIHIGDYGQEHLRETAHPSLGVGSTTPIVELLEEAIATTPNLPLIRISSLEPSELSDSLVALLKKYPDHFCYHFHLPLQSGSNKILKLMRREYSAEEYAEKIATLRKELGQISVGADVIPGFPGEDDEDHKESCDFIRSLGLSYLHVFPYSKRPNTAALRMPGHLSPEVIKARAKELRDLSEELSLNFQRSLLGTIQRVIWEKSIDKQGRRIGRSSLYAEVVAPSGFLPVPGTVDFVRIKGIAEDKRLLGISLKNPATV